MTSSQDNPRNFEVIAYLTLNSPTCYSPSELKFGNLFSYYQKHIRLPEFYRLGKNKEKYTDVLQYLIDEQHES